jgi:flavin reductase (DIM6/NTAB) family NADH-FMN oxidoreductase RutF
MCKHTIFIAEVVDVFIGKKNPKPLIYIDRAFRSLK